MASDSRTVYIIKAQNKLAGQVLGDDGWFEFSRTTDYDEAREDLGMARAYYDDAKIEEV